MVVADECSHLQMIESAFDEDLFPSNRAVKQMLTDVEQLRKTLLFAAGWKGKPFHKLGKGKEGQGSSRQTLFKFLDLYSFTKKYSTRVFNKEILQHTKKYHNPLLISA